MELKIIRNENDYHAALDRLSALMQAQPDTPEGDELELLSLVLEKYEQEHFPIGLPDPIAAIEFRMEQQGLTHKDLIPFIGSQSKVSEVLSGKRPLSLTMIRALHAGLDIPAEILLQEPGKHLDAPYIVVKITPLLKCTNAVILKPSIGIKPQFLKQLC